MEKAERRLRVPARSAVWYTGINFATKSVGILTTPFFTRLLGVGDYGVYSLYMSVLGVLSVGLSAFFSSGAIYRCFGKFSDERHSFLCSGFLVAGSVSLLICPLLFAFLPYTGLDSRFSILIVLQIFLDAVIALRCAELKYGYEYRTVAFINLVIALMGPALGAALIVGGGLSYLGRIFGLLLTSGTVALPLLATVCRRGRVKGSMCTEIVKKSAPLLPQTASSATWGQLDKILIGSLAGTAALAKYSIAHSLGIALTTLTGGISAALLPWMSRKLTTGDGDTVRRVNDCLYAAFGAGALFVVGLAPEAMRLLAPAEYSDATVAVAPIALSALPAFATSILSSGAALTGRSGRTAIPSLSGVLLSLLMNLLLLERLGFFGAGLSLLVSQLLALGASVLFYKGERSMSTDAILNPLLYAFAISLPLALLYDHLWARLLILTVPACIAITRLLSLKELITE